MRLGIMQPYFFPYVGYYSLIKQTDYFILLDEVQFIRHGWIERNRILKQSGGWNYIAVPLEKHSRNTVISDIRINYRENWKQKIFSQLSYYKKAPNYAKVIDLVKDVFEEDYQDIVSYDYASIKCVNNYLGINTPIKIFSKMNLSIDKPNAADEWALNICKQIDGVSEYWNPVGGLDFFDKQKYVDNNIQIYFQKMKLQPYRQFSKEFEQGLSILDVLMFNGVDEVNQMLDEFDLL